MGNPSEVHNRLARDFVMMAGAQTHSRSDLLVLVESTLLASLDLLVKLYGESPSHASVYVESALHAATERFAKGSH